MENSNRSPTHPQKKEDETYKQRKRLERVISNITDDLWIEILVRLPLKSLLVFKSVSKSWFSIISSHRFAKSHLHRAITRGDDQETLIIHHRPELDDDDYDFNDKELKDGPYSLSHLSSGDIFEYLGSPYSQSDYPFEPISSVVVGSDCGIVCVSVEVSKVSDQATPNEKFDIYLWNPTTKLSKLIPPPLEAGRTTSGFGFDHVGLDFKVVNIQFVSRTLSAEVYSSNRNAWRKIEPEPIDYPFIHTFHVCMHGFLLSSGYKGMMAFDLTNEVFICNIKLPVEPLKAHIADFNDSIAVCTIHEDLENKLMLWTLDDEACLSDCGVEVSWTLILSIKVGGPFDYVKGLFNSVEFLLEDKEGDWLFYNTKEEVISDLLGYSDIFKYTKSLFSIVGSKPVKWIASSSRLED